MNIKQEIKKAERILGTIRFQCQRWGMQLEEKQKEIDLLNLDDCSEKEIQALMEIKAQCIAWRKMEMQQQEKIDLLNQKFDQLSVFTINEIGDVLAYVVSKMEEQEYVYQRIPFINSHGSMCICALVRKSEQEYPLQIPTNNVDPKGYHILNGAIYTPYENENVSAADFLDSRGEDKKIFRREFVDSGFPYLTEFIEDLACSRTERKPDLTTEEKFALAQQFLSRKKEEKKPKVFTIS